jgi:hypothetical protein
MITQFTSPFTGNTYEVATVTHKRMKGDWYNNEPLREVEVTEYVFSLDGKRRFTTLTLEEQFLNAIVGEQEGHYKGWTTSRFD